MRITLLLLLLIFITMALLQTSCKSDTRQGIGVGDIQNNPTDSRQSTETKESAAIKDELAWEGDIKETENVDEQEEVKAIAPDDKIEKVAKAKVRPKRKKTVKKKPKKNLSKIVFEELEFDFGKIVEGDTIEHNFVFTNEGTAPLEVISANASCGCTRPSFPFIPIDPGEQGYIGVEYISINKEGDQKPEITITSNGSVKPIVLHLVGFIEPKSKVEKSVKLDTLTPIKLPNKG